MLTVVTSFSPTDTGFVVQFDQALDPATICCDSGQAADVTLQGDNSGAIQGSVVLSSDLTQLTFVADSDSLAPDTYTASLFDSIYDAEGAALDGDADGTSGGMFTSSFIINADGGGGGNGGGVDSGDGGDSGDTGSGGDNGSDGSSSSSNSSTTTLPQLTVVNADFDAFEHRAQMTVTIGAPMPTDLTLNYTTVDGTANSQDGNGLNKDYDSAAGSVVILAGQTSATIGINIHSDSDYQDPRSFTLRLLDPTDSQVIAQGTGTIHDVRFSIQQIANVSEAAGTVRLSIRPSSAPFESPVTVDIQDRAGSAMPGSDYVSNFTILSWDVGDNSEKFVTISIIDDTIPESDKDFFVDLSNPSFANAAPSSAFLDNDASTCQVNIVDDDMSPQIRVVASASATEGSSILFTASLSSPSNQTVSVDYSTCDDTAVAGIDYDATYGTLVFQPGETEASFSIATYNDYAALGNKNFFVNLYSPSNADLDATASSATGTILDNPPPTAVDDTYSIQQEQTLSISADGGVLANDSNPASGSLSAILVGTPAHGSVSLNSDGSFTYMPNAFYSGSDTFTYRANNGDDSNVATVSIFIIGGPSLQDQTYYANQNHPIDVGGPGLLSGAIDPNGYSISAIEDAGPTVNGGAYVVHSDGSFSYMPPAGFVGSDSFGYSATNGQSASSGTVNVIVTPAPAPTAMDHSYSLTQYGTLQAGDLLDGASDPNGYAICTVNDSGSTGNGSFSVNSDGTFSYTPYGNFSGTDSFTFAVTNGSTTGIATASIYIQPLPTPYAYDQSFSMQENGNVSGVLPGADTGLWIAATSGFSANGSFNVGADGTFTYWPASGFYGTDSFTYTVTNGFDNATANVVINVTPIAAPQVQNQTFTINQYDTLAGGGLLNGDTDPNGLPLSVISTGGSTGMGYFSVNSDGSFSYSPIPGFSGTDSFAYDVTNGWATSSATATIVIVPISAPFASAQSFDVAEYGSVNGTLTGAGDGLWIVADNGSTAGGSYSISTDGSFSYTPSYRFTGADSFSYTVTNGWVSATATVTMNVQALPNPYASDQFLEMQENSSLSGTLPGADTGVWVIANSGSTANGSFSVGADGTFSYTPTLGFSGGDSFTYTVTNGYDNATALVAVTVDALPAPLVQSQTFTMNQYDALSGGGLLSGDTDPNGLAIWVVASSGSTGVGSYTIGSDGSFSYTPYGSFSGTDSFSFDVTNGWATSSASVSIVIVALPTPLASAQSIDMGENSSASGILSGADNGLWIVADSGSTANGSYSIASDGSFSYTPNPDYVGTDNFGYTVTNGHDISLATITLNVFAV